MTPLKCGDCLTQPYIYSNTKLAVLLWQTPQVNLQSGNDNQFFVSQGNDITQRWRLHNLPNLMIILIWQIHLDKHLKPTSNCVAITSCIDPKLMTPLKCGDCLIPPYLYSNLPVYLNHWGMVVTLITGCRCKREGELVKILKLQLYFCNANTLLSLIYGKFWIGNK